MELHFHTLGAGIHIAIIEEAGNRGVRVYFALHLWFRQHGLNVEFYRPYNESTRSFSIYLPFFQLDNDSFVEVFTHLDGTSTRIKATRGKIFGKYIFRSSVPRRKLR